MLGESKTLKDSRTRTEIALRDTSFSLSYTKTNKLIAGLYMVTDIMDIDEPMRAKLRTLGTEIISDIYSAGFISDISDRVVRKVTEIVSFLDISSAIGIISPMNYGILKKEFSQLKESALDAGGRQNKYNQFGGHSTLSDFLKESDPVILPRESRPSSIGHIGHTRIGVQKGHTLMKALSDRITIMSDTKPSADYLKRERRDEIIKIIKDNQNGATITDIKTKAHGNIASSSEKTLQRELIAMVKENVLYKTGEKRWSRYFIKT